MNRKKKELRSARTFPKNTEDLTKEVLNLIEEQGIFLPLNATINATDRKRSPEKLDAEKAIIIIEDEYGVYLEDFRSIDKSYTIRDVIDNLAEKIGVKKMSIKDCYKPVYVPTQELRWLIIKTPERDQQVLQQRWVTLDGIHNAEWRDVSVVVEKGE